jgi:hypothetical protein
MEVWTNNGVGNMLATSLCAKSLNVGVSDNESQSRLGEWCILAEEWSECALLSSAVQ